MKKLKKLLGLCLALTACCSFAFTGCNDDDKSSSPVNTDTEQSGNSESEESDDEGGDEKECRHELNDGICIYCEGFPDIPDAPKKIRYINNFDEGNPFEENGETGEEYNRYEVEIGDNGGYYEFEISQEKTWVSLSVPEAGQYAIYTIDTPENTTVTRYDASTFYIPPTGETARTLSDEGFLPAGTLFSDVNCSTTHWNAQWRATWAIEAPNGSTVKVRFVCLGDPAWIPQYVYEDVIPTEINGKKAPEAEEAYVPVTVPYESEYFYDEDCGYYRMGSKENAGEIIYVAITAPAARLLGEKSFTNIQYEGNNLSLGDGTTEDGDYLVKNYVPFIMNNGGDQNAEADKQANCYQNYVNSDGLYPVTQELYRFLNLYVGKNRPFDIPDELWSNEINRKQSAWLSACYYYDELTLGSIDRPIEITAEQFNTDITVNTIEWDYVYYTVTAGEKACAITSTESNSLIIVNGGEPINGPFTVVVNAGETVTFMLAAADGSEISYNIRIKV